MWSQFISVTYLASFVMADILLPGGPPGVFRYASEGVKSIGYKIVYGNQDIDSVNEVVKEAEKRHIKLRENITEVLPPLPSQDVKCLMSIDKHCNKEMAVMKNILIRVVTEDCRTCTLDEKQRAGKVVASMLAHNQVAWKHFLSRSALLVNINSKPKEETRVKEKYTKKQVGEHRVRINKRFVMPGVVVTMGYKTETVFNKTETLFNKTTSN